jgi:hypothetical protein
MGVHVLPWWGWILGGIAGVYVGRFVGRVSEFNAWKAGEVAGFVIDAVGVLAVIIGIVLLIL